MAASVKLRLSKYTSVDCCGDWNAAILDDFNADIDIARVSNELHQKAMDTKLGTSPVMDGSPLLRNVEIEFSHNLTLLFELSFLSPQYFVSPALFKLTLDEKDSESGFIKYGCGTLDRDGELRVTNSKHCVFPNSESEWAVFRSCRFGDNGLTHWLTGKRDRR